MIHSTRLNHFPIMMFAITMGLSGIAIVYQKATLWLGLPSSINLTLIILATLIFITIASTYALKILFYFEAVIQEFNHPIRINFFATVSISLLLFSIIYSEISITLSSILWYIGATLQTFLTFYTINFWMRKNIDITHLNPAWFIPIVGNVIVPIGGESFVPFTILFYFFTVGIFFWIILLPIIMNRIIFHQPLTHKFIPTLFIMIAPPSISFMSYIKLTGDFDLFASFLYNIGLFFTLLLLLKINDFIKLPFFISWWAFTFPLTAITIASLLAYHTTHILLYSYIAYLLILITTVVIFIVGYKTLFHIMKKDICIAE